MSTNRTGFREPSILNTLRDAYRCARELLEGVPATTGRRWKRPPRECPPWCARDHTCTVRPINYGPGLGYRLPGPQSEHRSPIATWRRPWGALLATRVQALTGPPRLELRAQIRLSETSENLALAQGINLPLVVEQAITTTLAELEVQARYRAMAARARQHDPIQATAANRPSRTLPART